MTLAVFDIGGTAVKYALWEKEHITHQGNFKTPSSWEKMKEQIKQVFDQLDQKATESLNGATFSFPGAVYSEEGIIRGISAVPYIHNFPIKSELKKTLGVRIEIENDANCAALAEVWQGAASDVNHALFFVIGSGIGGAVIINRQLFKGRNLFGGEFGYMLLNDTETLSTLASPVHASKRYSKKMGKEQSIDGKALFFRAENGEKEAQIEVDKMLNSMARGIQNLLVAFNPERVIIGGAISANNNFIERLNQKVNEKLTSVYATDVKVPIVSCQFRNDANLIGAVAAFMTD